ncbi:MAG: hypothetical protein RR280_09160 [Bacteroidaceae bacterium]
MIKRVMTGLLLLVAVVSANAQFESGKKYVSASLTGLNLQYSSSEKFRLGVDVKAGCFFADNFLAVATVGYDHTKSLDEVTVGLGARYYLSENGIYLGAGGEYSHLSKNNNDFMIPLEVGYSFFLNRYLTLEPALYYKMSLHNFSDNSTIGLRVGVGYYF